MKNIDLTLKTDLVYFNHRVAAVILNDNKILAQKNIEDSSYYLVGGIVRFGESTREALIREIKEELGIDINHFKPIWINECFFKEKEESYHEIGMYYLVDIVDLQFNHFEKEFHLKEKHRTNYYEWLDIDNLSNITLYPEFIKKEIHNIENNLKLIITRE